MRTMAAGKFKATCLAVLDEVEQKRVPVLVTKNGRPVAKMVPLDLAEGEDPLDAFYFGKLEIVGDLLEPVYTDQEWGRFFAASHDQLGAEPGAQPGARDAKNKVNAGAKVGARRVAQPGEKSGSKPGRRHPDKPGDKLG